METIRKQSVSALVSVVFSIPYTQLFGQLNRPTCHTGLCRVANVGGHLHSARKPVNASADDTHVLQLLGGPYTVCRPVLVICKLVKS